MKNFIKADKIHPDSLMAEMKVRVVVKDNARMFILHDRPLPPVGSLEFFADTGDLYLNFEDGSVRHLGMTIPAGADRRHMGAAKLAWFYHLDAQEKITGCQEAPVINA